MAWSKAQRSLLDLAREAIPAGRVCVDRVELSGCGAEEEANNDFDKQVEDVLPYIQEASARFGWGGPRNLAIEAGRFSWALSSLQAHAGGTRGRDCLDRAWKAMEKLGEKGPHCLWMCESRALSVPDQEGLTFLLAYCARLQSMPLRIVYLTGPTWRYIPERRAQGRAPMLFSGRLRARRLELTKSGLEILPMSGGVERAVASA